MLKSIPPDLQPETSDFLANRQRQIDALATHADRAEEARRQFSNKNNKAFRNIKDCLVAGAPGSDRGYCVYCEHDRQSAVEHIYPLVHYPERSHVWENLVYACTVCNSIRKSDIYAIFDSNEDVIEFNSVSLRGSAPPNGPQVFIDPRSDEPLEFLMIDLKTGGIAAKPGLSSRDEKRAKFTIKVLGLNEDGLPRRRIEYLHSFVKRIELLSEAVQTRNIEAQSRMIEALRNTLHPSVLVEMERQKQHHSWIGNLIDNVPSDLVRRP